MKSPLVFTFANNCFVYEWDNEVIFCYNRLYDLNVKLRYLRWNILCVIVLHVDIVESEKNELVFNKFKVQNPELCNIILFLSHTKSVGQR